MLDKFLGGYMNVRGECGICVFAAIPLSLKAGVLGRLLLLVPPFQRNTYPHVPSVWSS